MDGMLTIHGVTRPEHLDVTITGTAAEPIYHAAGNIDRHAFGMKGTRLDRSSAGRRTSRSTSRLSSIVSCGVTPEVFFGSVEAFEIFVQQANAEVAIIAEQPAHTSADVTVIHVEPLEKNHIVA